MSFPTSRIATSERIAKFAEVYGMPGRAVDGNDLLAVREAVMEAVEHVRGGNGPALVVSDTYRWRGHSKSDRNLYRTQEEIDEWQEKDPIRRFKDYVIKEGLFTDDEIEAIREESYGDIESARLFAEASPEPSIDTIEEGVYAP